MTKAQFFTQKQAADHARMIGNAETIYWRGHDGHLQPVLNIYAEKTFPPIVGALAGNIVSALHGHDPVATAAAPGRHIRYSHAGTTLQISIRGHDGWHFNDQRAFLSPAPGCPAAVREKLNEALFAQGGLANILAKIEMTAAPAPARQPDDAPKYRH